MAFLNISQGQKIPSFAKKYNFYHYLIEWERNLDIRLTLSIKHFMLECKEKFFYVVLVALGNSFWSTETYEKGLLEGQLRIVLPVIKRMEIVSQQELKNRISSLGTLKKLNTVPSKLLYYSICPIANWHPELPCDPLLHYSKCISHLTCMAILTTKLNCPLNLTSHTGCMLW